jgi:hypothetical protein
VSFDLILPPPHSRIIWQTHTPPISTPADTSVEEAECLLEIAHARRDAFRAQKMFADYRIKETLIRVQLYQIRAAKAGKRLFEAHLDVGRARICVGKARKEANSRRVPSPLHTPSMHTSCE